MKRLKSSEDLHSYGEKAAVKDWGRREEDSALHRTSFSHRSSHYKSSEGGRKLVSSSTSRYDRLEDDRENSRMARKRSDYELESYDRRKSYDRNRDGNERGIMSSSPRAGYGMERMYRSESFSVPRRDFPKGFRSERDRSRREGSVTSWRRLAGGKDGDDVSRIDGIEVGRGGRVESDDTGRVKSPQGLRDAKSPAWSKDSGSEQSKSVEVKKSEDMPVESSGPSIEREEGELDPDPQPLPSLIIPDSELGDGVKLNSSQDDIKRNSYEVCPGEKNSLSVEKIDASIEEQAECESFNDAQFEVRENEELSDRLDTQTPETIRTGDENEAKEVKEQDDIKIENTGDHLEEDGSCAFTEKSPFTQAQNQEKVNELEMRSTDTGMIGNTGSREKIEMLVPEEIEQSLKDKGKCVAVLPSNLLDVSDTNLENENKQTNFTTCGNVEKEGRSTRGFQFFSTLPVKKQDRVEQASHNKPKEDKLALELSLSLPNVLLPLGSHNIGQAPSSPSYARSAQSFPSSFRTSSDGFTASMSFSGSQKFTHNPSCSLTHNAFDFEQSVGSKPLFQGVDWNSLSMDENKNSEVPAYIGVSSRGNTMFQQPQIFHGNSSGQADVHPLKTGKSSKVPMGIEKQMSLNKHLSEAQGVGSFENGPEYYKDKRQLSTDLDGGLRGINNIDGKDPGLVVGADFAESIITMMVSEPFHAMAQRFNDMTSQQMSYVKEFVCDIFSNKAKKWQLSALQKAMRKRGDITLDSMANAHRFLLEILVALKTGVQDYLLQKYEVPSVELAEIFLYRRCRNVTCRTLLPVDECDCKICSHKNGFCRDCMCLVCSKFDLASDTCSWVGCDVCLHWCHADCGLRESHIRNGRSESGALGSKEMQFHCVACDHPSEMFGFVKEVFNNFVKMWNVENLSRELEYVRRIFCASEDVRGKQLHEIAIRILSKLADGMELKDAQNHILNYFTEAAETIKPNNIPIELRKELPVKNQMAENGIAGPSQGNCWMKPMHPDKSPHFDNSINLLPVFDSDRNDKYSTNFDLRTNPQKEPIFDELESIVRIKQAEANMFQTRADDARRDAEALKRISVTKDEKIEEEYTSRITKLRLAEAEDMRRQKMEELQALDRAYQEYFSMKMRMETDIKDLLLKMEATRRNLPT